MLKGVPSLRALSPRNRRHRSRSRLILLIVLALFLTCILIDSLFLHSPLSTFSNRLKAFGSSRSSSYGSTESSEDGSPERLHLEQWMFPQSQSPIKASQNKLNATSSELLVLAETILESTLAHGTFLHNSNIPLIIHQTWRSRDSSTWPDTMIETRRRLAQEDSNWRKDDLSAAAWLMWDDQDIDALIRKYEPDLYSSFSALPYPVEKADLFRVVVLKWFGGVYIDADCRLLQHPLQWTQPTDRSRWSSTHTDEGSKDTLATTTSRTPYAIPSSAPKRWKDIISQHRPDIVRTGPTVSAIFGIEADFPPDPDPAYWRAGYTYPVQLTNWAMAMAPLHPIAVDFIDSINARIQENLSTISSMDPLDIAGPPALTASVMQAAKQHDSLLDWNDLSGRNDTPGGRGKMVAGDTLILPITGFSPGRGSYNNMGSQGIDHPNAKVQHIAAGSWKKFDLKVTTGKLCRTLFGGCKEWSKWSGR